MRDGRGRRGDQADVWVCGMWVRVVGRGQALSIWLVDGGWLAGGQGGSRLLYLPSYGFTFLILTCFFFN